MKTSQKGVDLIKKFEGLRLKQYRCSANVRTIGYGHTGPDVTEGLVITHQRAEELLVQDLAKFEQGVQELVPTTVTQTQFDAMVALAFNIGLTNFRKSSVVRLLRAGDPKGSADAFLLWTKARVDGVLTVLPGLVKRREAERALFLS